MSDQVKYPVYELILDLSSKDDSFPVSTSFRVFDKKSLALLGLVYRSGAFGRLSRSAYRLNLLQAGDFEDEDLPASAPALPATKQCPHTKSEADAYSRVLKAYGLEDLARVGFRVEMVVKVNPFMSDSVE